MAQVKYSEKYFESLRKVLQKNPCIKDLCGSSVFITGASGLICSAVADLLFLLNDESSAKIKIFLGGRNKNRIEKRFSLYAENSRWFFVPYDATLSAEFSIQPDFIVHGASNSSPEIFGREPVETMLANIVGLDSLFRLAVKSKSRRLLYVSSSEIYGQKKSAEPYRENDLGFVDILNPRACYPSSKRAAETLCASYAKEFGADFVIVRPGHVYGPGFTESDSRLSSEFVRNVLAGKSNEMKTPGLQMRSYCHSADCATAILTVLLKGESKNAYNISNPRSVVTIKNFAECLAEESGTKLNFAKASDEEKQNYNMMENSSLDSTKLEQLGWKPCFNLRDEIRNTLDCLV